MIQIYNWTEDTLSNTIEECKPTIKKYFTNNIIIANARNKNKKFSFLFEVFYQVTVIKSDAERFITEHNNIIINYVAHKSKEVIYGAKEKDYVTFYIKSYHKKDFETYNSKFTKYDYFFNRWKINPSSTIDQKKLEDLIKPSLKFEDEDVYILNNDIKINKFKSCIIENSLVYIPYILAFDTEVFTKGRFPNANTVENAITKITLKYEYTSPKSLINFLESLELELPEDLVIKSPFILAFSYYRKNYSKLKENANGNYSLVYERNKENPLSEKILSIECTTEGCLIKLFKNFFEDVDIDHITGHNVIAFDIIYFNDRAYFLQKNKNYCIKVTTSNVFNKQELHFRENKTKNITVYTPIKTGNKIIIDYYNYVKKYRDKLRDHKLMTCAIEFLTWNSTIININESEIIVSFPVGDKYELLKTAKNIVLKDSDQIIELKTNNDGIVIPFENLPYSVIGNKICLSHCKTEIDLIKVFDDYTKENDELTKYYCVHDTALSFELYKLEKISLSIHTFAMTYYMSQGHVLIYGNTKSFCSMLLQTLSEKSLIISTPIYKDKKKYAAAYVQTPEDKIINDPIVGFDLNTMYPNNFIYGNLSHETHILTLSFKYKYDLYVSVEKLKKEYLFPDFIIILSSLSPDEAIMEYYIDVFDRRIKGFIPTLLESLINKRNDVKKKIKILKSKENSDLIVNEIDYLDRLQTALKLAGNSAYGLLGSKTFPYPKIELSRACCAMGVCIIYYVIEAVRTNTIINTFTLNGELFIQSFQTETINDLIHPWSYEKKKVKIYKEIKDKQDNQIKLVLTTNSCYGDTDSVFVRFKLKSITSNEIIKLSNKNHKLLLKVYIMFSEYYESILNDILWENISIKFEKLITYANFIKKAYSYYIYENINDVDKNAKLTYSGTSVVQKSTCLFQKKTIKLIDSIRREKVIIGLPHEVVMNSIKNELISIITDLKNGVKDRTILFKDFARNRGYKKSKNIDSIPTQNVLNHNKRVAESIDNDQNSAGTIIEGDRYHFVVLIDDIRYNNKVIWNLKVNSAIQSHETIISLRETSIPGKRIWIEYYIKLIMNDLERKFEEPSLRIFHEMFSN